MWGFLPGRLHSEFFLRKFPLKIPQISSQILHFLPAWLVGWKNKSHPDNHHDSDEDEDDGDDEDNRDDNNAERMDIEGDEVDLLDLLGLDP